MVVGFGKKSKTSAGYGQFTRFGKYYTTHRYMCTVFKGEPKKGEVVRHLCHTRLCCNPEHLEWGTQKENYNDSIDVYNAVNKSRALNWDVCGTVYSNIREASRVTGVSVVTLAKYTDKVTRIFDVDSYIAGCKKANVIPSEKVVQRL